MISRVLQDGSHPFGRSGHLKKSRELRLAARSAMIPHHLLGNASRDGSAYITGQLIVIDGGNSIQEYKGPPDLYY